ncbi:SMC family ATPase [Labedella phragmitis]|uniref:Nuclease SbcCD subunit C n=1 Tax=Labedella phragmitis TaxID=2498849 RepID=A0A3S3Z841_9MICO|nr:SMC family ATPase [Labedella phragmitis]RWZ50870.1 SMC family ATPase [Labedella phragmitis]
MRITRLSFAGFGPYRDEQNIDFRAFEDDGIYLIAGRTGAGKSTILDAVCFALYASVPRFEKGEARLRSDHCAPEDPTWVALEFSAGGHDYRVTRSPAYERPKSRGEGTTVSPPSAELAMLVDGDWHGVAARPKDVGIRLADIVQLTRDQFLQVILLAQNRFQRFLAAGHDERQDVLRSLFATERFSSFEDYLVERRKAVENELGAELATVERLAERATDLVATIPRLDSSRETSVADDRAQPTGADPARGEEPPPVAVRRDSPDETWFAERVASLLPLLTAAERRVAAADAAADAAEEEDRRVEELARRIRRRDAARLIRQELDARAAADAADSAELERARAAAPLWPLVVAIDTGQDRASAAAEELDRARRAFEESLAGTDVSDVDASTPAPIAVDVFTRELGSLTEAAAEERTLPGLDDDVQRAEDRVSATRRAVDEASVRRDEIPSELEAARAAVTAARAAAAELDAATSVVERLKRQSAAAHDVRSRAEELRRADAAEIAARQAARDASAHLEHLLTVRLGAYAGELAERLLDGEPCAVCGSTVHPAPAAPPADDDRVGDDDIEAARAADAERSILVERASRAAREADTAHKQAIVASGGATVDELEAQLADAESHRDACASARARLPRLEAVVDELGAEAERADAVLDDLVRQRDAATEALVAATTRRDAARSRVTAARGESASVADRVARTTGRRDAAAALAAASSAAEERMRELSDARSALDTAITNTTGRGQDFADAEAVRAAHRDGAHIRTLEKRVAAAADARVVNTATLSDPDLADLPSDAPDTAASAAAVVEARTSRDRVLADLHTLQSRERELATVRREALSALSAVRARRDEADAIRGLADAVEGKSPNTRRMDLETFVLAAQLEQIIAAANRRFHVMTSGRFTLEHDDSVAYRNAASGLGLAIRDEYTGRARPTASLSGGETFLAALALALGLAEVVTERAGGITLDTLFIDEGFGSLDGETLEIAMSTLDELRAGGRTVGLISHVDAMKERISARLTVEVDESGASRVRQHHATVPV